MLYKLAFNCYRKLASTKPIVLVYEDLQWIDSASLDLVGNLLPLIQDMPILFVCVYRPEKQHPFQSLRNRARVKHPDKFAEIILKPFEEEATKTLLDSLPPVQNLPAWLRQEAVENSLGNPLYLIEITQTLIDMEAITPGDDGWDWQEESEVMPGTFSEGLLSLISERIELLPEEALKILRLAGVIGRSFDVRIVKQVLQSARGTLAYLDLLIDRDFVEKLPANGGVLFAFRHPLILEAVYKMVLRRQRRIYHRQVGEALLALFPDKQNLNASRLAHHFDRARDERATQYHGLAGDMALRLYATEESTGHYRRALELALAKNDSDQETLKYLFRQRGQAQELSGHYAAALTGYEEMEVEARTRQMPALELEAVVLQGTIHSTANDQANPEEAEALARRGLSMARMLGSRRAEAKIFHNLLNLYRYTDRLSQAVMAGERAVQKSREMGMRELRARCLTDLIHVYINDGQMAKGLETAEQAMAGWQQIGNKVMFAECLTTMAVYQVLAGNLEQALQAASEAVTLNDAIENHWGLAYSQHMIGLAYWEQGKLDEALSVMQQAILSADQSNYTVVQTMTQALYMLMLAQLGLVEEAEKMIETITRISQDGPDALIQFSLALQAQVYSLTGKPEAAAYLLSSVRHEEAQTDNRLMRLYTTRALAQAAFHQQDYEVARQHTRELLDWAENAEMGLYLPEALYLHGLVQMKTGQPVPARAMLEQAKEQAERIGSRWTSWQILSALADLTRKKKESLALRKEAASIVSELADSLDDSAFRETFTKQASAVSLPA
jgi:tetratricopeptide (TPR) repeat protein